ncbi:MAG: maleylpyruvate isomerase family mycothiol-dependent enzyme [Acidimicrobiales bacterium]
MIDYVECTAAESRRFQQAVDAIRSEDGGRSLASVAVPSCPDWTAADLTWHLAEVQYFWATIVEGNLASYTSVEELERPADDRLPALAVEQSTRLITQLSAHAAGEPCWSWHDDGHTVGWVRRRQAHEALIHRVDAELALETVVPDRRTAIDEDLAADGVDEILGVMLDVSNRPDWARFDPDGTSVRIEVPGRSWSVRLGRFVGTDPTGDEHDTPALELLSADGATGHGEPTAVVRGPASEIDLWLWRRGSLDESSVAGDRATADRLQDLAAVQ